MSYSASLALTAPEIILSTGGIVLMLAAAFAGDRATRAITWASVALFAIAALSLIGLGGNGTEAFGGLYRADAFSNFAKFLIYVAAAVSVAIAPRWFAQNDRLRAEYPVLILFSAVGMGMMVSAIDLLTLYVGLELQSLAAYVLASFARTDERAAEAGLKYFVLGALASGILLYGISLLYGFSGSTSYTGVANAMAGGVSLGELFGIVFVLSGLAFKISAVPFHMWTPDVYEGAPTPVTAFFASAPKVAAMALFVRVTSVAMGPATEAWHQIVIFMALASIVLGAIGAIGQTNIKRLLAYSSINNVGFALIGAAAGTAAGAAAVMSYMAVYVAVTLGSFLCVLQMRDSEGKPIETIASLSGLSRTRPGLAAALAIFMFSLAGIPPLFGFWPKLLVFSAAVDAHLLGLAIAGAVGSVIGAFYYLKIIKTMYFDEPANEIAPLSDPIEVGMITALAALMVVGYALIPVLGDFTAAAAKALF